MLNKIKLIVLLLFLILLVSGLLWGWALLKDPRIFPINKVQIKATYQHINPRTLQMVIAPYVNKSFFDVNILVIKEHILQLPWVNSVTINRVWPDQILIKLTEQKAVARWNDDSLLNSNVEIFTPSRSTFPDDLPLLLGPDDQVKEVWQYYQQINEALTELGLQVTRMNLSSDGSWRLTLNNGIDVILGNADIINKIYMFIKIYPKVIGVNSDNVKSVDLRYANGLAVQWKKLKK